MNDRIAFITAELIDQYTIADHNRTWVIGFSGGKDSTVLLTLVWMALSKVKDRIGEKHLKRAVYVVCNDTLVENPIIAEYAQRVLGQIERAATLQGLPIRVKKTTPKLADSFWVNLIGKGYPAPNNAFRWCTERLKIRPTVRFIDEITAAGEEAIILVGTRKSESANRAKSIKKHEIKGKRLSKHPLQKNVSVYAPIRDLTLEEIWYIIHTYKSPWGMDHTELSSIYSDASADDYECPTMVSDKEHKPCGQSRFGCWTCTVVKWDKSISAQIKRGREWLVPLRDLRDWIQRERNKAENRCAFRRNGDPAINGMGVVEPKHRAEILKRVFEAQKEIGERGIEIKLIRNRELVAIQTIWHRDLHFDYRVSDIYNAVFHEQLDMKQQGESIKKEEAILLSACNGDKTQVEIIQGLLRIQNDKATMKRRHGLSADIEGLYKKHIK